MQKFRNLSLTSKLAILGYASLGFSVIGYVIYTGTGDNKNLFEPGYSAGSHYKSLSDTPVASETASDTPTTQESTETQSVATTPPPPPKPQAHTVSQVSSHTVRESNAESTRHHQNPEPAPQPPAESPHEPPVIPPVDPLPSPELPPSHDDDEHHDTPTDEHREDT